MTDKIHRFIFDAHGIRGEMVRLEDSCQKMLQNHKYPPTIASLLQQTAAASVMLATTLKFEGKMSIQLITQGCLKMLLVQTTHNLGYRGLVRYDQQADYTDLAFSDLVKDGQMTITIEPKKGKRYQGIVPLSGNSIAECIENYFNQSEQLETRIWLFNNESQVYGMMLQALPDMLSKDSFEHLVYLASTLAQDESLSVDNEILMHRLFHQESIQNLVVEPVSFNCGCSEKKMLDSISLLPSEEIQQMLSEKGHIAVKCEFCWARFSFDEVDIKSHLSLDGNSTKH